MNPRRKASTPSKQSGITARRQADKKDTTEVAKVVVAAPQLQDTQTATPEVIDPMTATITKMADMMEKMQAMMFAQQEQITGLAAAQAAPKEDENVFTKYGKPLRSKQMYRLVYIKYDAEGNKIFDNPGFNYRDFDDMESMLAYADENNLGPLNGRRARVPVGVPMPDSYWKDKPLD